MSQDKTKIEWIVACWHCSINIAISATMNILFKNLNELMMLTILHTQTDETCVLLLWLHYCLRCVILLHKVVIVQLWLAWYGTFMFNNIIIICLVVFVDSWLNMTKKSQNIVCVCIVFEIITWWWAIVFANCYITCFNVVIEEMKCVNSKIWK